MTKTKLPKISALRNIEYYDFQEVLDRLYADSENSKKFKNLMGLITSPQNILLAYRNIKKNTGSKTAGVDKKTITHLEKWEPEKLIRYVQKRLDYGTNILVDLDRRSNDKTNGSALILGNSGQGKSYLMKLLLTNFRESGKAVICLDVEAEYEDLTRNLGGCYVDYMTGEYIINPLEPKVWSVDAEEPDTDGESPEAFRKVTRLSQHIAFLKDFFRSYKDFTDAQVDTMEILLEKLYAQRGITDSTDFSALSPIHYPVMAEFYWLCQKEYLEYDPGEKHLYTQEMLREICLGRRNQL